MDLQEYRGQILGTTSSDETKKVKVSNDGELIVSDPLILAELQDIKSKIEDIISGTTPIFVKIVPDD